MLLKDKNLTKLQEKILEQFRNELQIFKGRSFQGDPFLTIWADDSFADLIYLPSFHTVLRPEDEQTFSMNLVSFNGKIIHSVLFDYTNQDSIPSVAQDFLQLFVRKKWKLCKGFPFMYHLDADPDTSYPVLIEYLGERLIKRSRKCNFAVENTEKEVCDNCLMVESSKVLPVNSDDEVEKGLKVRNKIDIDNTKSSHKRKRANLKSKLSEVQRGNNKSSKKVLKKAGNPHSKAQETKSDYFEKCPICLDVYTLEKNFIYDKKLHEKILSKLDVPVECPICSIKIEKRRLLNLHYEEDHSDNNGDWNCDKAMCCECFAIMKRRSLKLHQKTKHEPKGPDQGFLCNICGKKSASKQILELHLARRHGLARDGISSPSSQVCDQCGRSYISIDLLKQHMSAIHRQRQRMECDLCKKTFYSKSALVTHKVCLHLKIHPFKCRMCSYKAGDLSGVYRHCENSHGYRGKRNDVIVDTDELRRIREICQFNYFANIEA